MEPYMKIIESGGKIPRKIKKRIKKIPVGDYCYGSKIGDKGKTEYGKKQYKGGCCPYYRFLKEATEEDDPVAYCTFVKRENDLELPDQVKICAKYERLFPEYRDDDGAKHKQYMLQMENYGEYLRQQEKLPSYQRQKQKLKQYRAQAVKSTNSYLYIMKDDKEVQ